MELFIQALQCTICMDDLFDPFGQHGEVQNTKCGHVFHADCLEASLQARRQCPMCRRFVFPWNIFPLHLPGIENFIQERRARLQVARAVPAAEVLRGNIVNRLQNAQNQVQDIAQSVANVQRTVQVVLERMELTNHNNGNNGNNGNNHVNGNNNPNRGPAQNARYRYRERRPNILNLDRLQYHRKLCIVCNRSFISNENTDVCTRCIQNVLH